MTTMWSQEVKKSLMRPETQASAQEIKKKKITKCKQEKRMMSCYLSEMKDIDLIL